jgi:hypothetical protein
MEESAVDRRVDGWKLIESSVTVFLPDAPNASLRKI